jgi:hypothetical protein
MIEKRNAEAIYLLKDILSDVLLIHTMQVHANNRNIVIVLMNSFNDYLLVNIIIYHNLNK